VNLCKISGLNRPYMTRAREVLNVLSFWTLDVTVAHDIVRRTFDSVFTSTSGQPADYRSRLHSEAYIFATTVA
jgi:hypothetical protein